MRVRVAHGDSSSRSGSRSGGSRVATLVTVGDQALSSLSNAMLLVALAQVASPAEFGRLSVVMLVATGALGFVRGGLGAPLLLLSDQDERTLRNEAGYAFIAAAAMSLLPAVVICIAGLSMGITVPALVLAVSVPFMLLQDVGRMTAIAMQRPQVAFASDLGWVLVIIVLMTLELATGRGSTSVWLAAWGVAGALAMCYIFAALRIMPRVNGVVRWVRRYMRQRINLGLTQSLDQLIAISVTAVVAGIAGASVVAGLRVAGVIFGPVTVLISAISLVFVPRIRRENRSMAQSWRSVRLVGVVLAALTLTVVTVVWALPRGLLARVFGASWFEAEPLIWFVAVEWVAIGFVAPVITVLLAFGRSRELLYLRIVQIALHVSLFAVVVSLWPTARGVGMASAVSGLSVLMVYLSGLWLALRRDRHRRHVKTVVSQGTEVADIDVFNSAG